MARGRWSETLPPCKKCDCAISAPAGAEVEIYDLRGRLVRAIIWTPDETINSGIYLVKARLEDGNCIMNRIIYLK